MRFFYLQLAAVLVLTFLADVIANIHFLALVRSDMRVAVTTIIAVHLLNYADRAWFAEAKGKWRRFLLNTAGSIGAALGSAVAIMTGG